MRCSLSFVPQSNRDRVVAALTLVGIFAAIVFVAMKDPRTHGMGVLCPSRGVFGIYCPGCGSTRSLYDILHGEYSLAFQNNPLMVLVGLPVLVAIMFSLASVVIRRKRPILGFPSVIGYSIAIFLVLYCVARNLPGEAFSALRPPAYALETQSSERRSAEEDGESSSQILREVEE